MTRADGLEYSIRVSDRARHVRLTVSARDGLVVVVPRGVRVDAECLVRSKEAWARRALERLAPRREQYLAHPQELLPTQIELAFNCGPLTVSYGDRDSTATATARATRVGDSLVVSGSAEATHRIEALRRWLSRAAHEELPPRVRALAAAHSIEIGAVRITSARTRWGSCSARKTISLSRSLMLLPDHLAQAVIAHEVAHARVMNHSAKFWRLLESIDPDARIHRAQLHDAAQLLPAWLDI